METLFRWKLFVITATISWEVGDIVTTLFLIRRHIKGKIDKIFIVLKDQTQNNIKYVIS